MRPPTLAKIFLIGGCLVLLVSGCLFFRPSWPLLYKPSCDLSPVLTMQVPDHIDTLAGCPRDKTVVENGINKGEGSRRTDGTKELFFLTKGDCQYEVWLFFTDGDALGLYESDKHYPFATKHYPVFRETVTDGCSGCLRYTEQERADPEGGSGAMGVYHSRASFRLHNAFIRVTTQDTTSQSDKLSIAVKDLAQMLNAALATTNQIPK